MGWCWRTLLLLLPDVLMTSAAPSDGLEQLYSSELQYLLYFVLLNLTLRLKGLG